MHCRLVLTIVCAVLLAAPIAASKIYYTTWSEQPNGFNSSFIQLDVATGQQRILFSHFSFIMMSTYNTKANLFHSIGNYAIPYGSNITTMDAQGNLIASFPTASDIKCLKYSPSLNTLFGARWSPGQITLISIDYTTGQVRERLSFFTYERDSIRSCDIDDATGRLVLHREINVNQTTSALLTVINYQANTVIGQYNVVLNNTQNNYSYLANVAFFNSQLACVVGSGGKTASLLQLGKLNLNKASGDVTPMLIGPKPVGGFATGLVWNSATSMFYTLSMGPEYPLAWHIDAYDISGARVSQTPVLKFFKREARNLLVV